MPEVIERDDGKGSISLGGSIRTSSEIDSGADTPDEHDLDEEEKGLIEEYLHSPAALHIRRYVAFSQSMLK